MHLSICVTVSLLAARSSQLPADSPEPADSVRRPTLGRRLPKQTLGVDYHYRKFEVINQIRASL